MKPLLVLHKRHTPDDSDIWRVAVRRGWTTCRTDQVHVKADIEGYEHIRYYGNTQHMAQIKDQLPIQFQEIDYRFLSELPLYTKRKIEYIRYETLGQPLKETLFVKPAHEKWFEARVYQEGECINGAPADTDAIYVSEVMKFQDEIRCFVLNGEILTSSLYRIDGKIWDQTDLKPEELNFDSRINDTPIPGMVKRICASGRLPNGVVIDFGYNTNRQYALIEFNEAWASGLYYCEPEKCFEVIINSQL